MAKILIDEAVVRQALEALEEFCELQTMLRPAERRDALRQALASNALDKMADNARELGLSYEQPAPAQPLPFGVGGGLVAIKTLLNRDPCAHAKVAIEMIDDLLAEQPAPAEPDPDELTIAYMSGLHEGKKRKPWVGLTDEEFIELCSADMGTAALIRAVEAKLKEKNTKGGT